MAALAASTIVLMVSTTLLPFAVRASENDPEVSSMVHIIAACFCISLLGVVFVLCRRHVTLRRQAGYDGACFDCLDLRAPANPWNPLQEHAVEGGRRDVYPNTFRNKLVYGR